MIDQRPVKATVIVLAYNHEKWISQALDSVLTQETDFDFEIVIIEDCSTDRTRDIVVGYADRHPGRFKLMLAEQNRNSNVDWVRGMRNARGNYIATLDGDDYWSSPHKLSKQVRFMEDHPDCSLAFHNVTCVMESGETFDHNPPHQKLLSTIEDLLLANFVPTAGAMQSKKLIDPIPDWLEQVKWGDWGLYLHAARHGTIRYMDEKLAVYRIHSGGAWWGLSEIQQTEGNILCYEQMNANLDYEYDGIIRQRLAQHHATLAQLKNAKRPADGAS